HLEEALVRRLVEAELLLERLDELRIEPLRAAIARGYVTAASRQSAIAKVGAAPGAPAGAGIGPLKHRNDALDRTAARELHDAEGHEEDPEQRRNHQEQAPNDVGGHLPIGFSRPPERTTITLSERLDLCRPVGIIPPSLGSPAVVAGFCRRVTEHVPV